MILPILGSATGLSPIPTNGLALWLRADKIAQSGGLASQINDQSSNANNCTAAGSARPTVVASALNGQPGLQFDGAATAMVSATNVVTAGSDRTVIAIVESTATSNNGGSFFDFRKGGADMYCAMGFASTPYVSGDNVAVNAALHNANFTSNTFQMLDITRTSNTAALFINGTSAVLDGATGFAADNGTAGYAVGARGGTSLFFTGIVCEIIVYDHVISAPDLATIKSYVRSRYGLTIA